MSKNNKQTCKTSKQCFSKVYCELTEKTRYNFLRENFIKLRDFILDEMMAFHKKKTRCNGYTVKAAKKC